MKKSQSIFHINKLKLAKRIVIALICALSAVLLICIAIRIYHYYFVERVQSDYSAKVENIKTMVRHNALQIVDEAVYTDTINGISEVYSVKARITVQYDLERMKYRFDNDTLLVELPHEIVQAHELDRRLLDEYYTDGKFHVTRPTITAKQSAEIEYRMKQFVQSTMVNQDHIKRARRNELANMVRLFSAIHGNVKVVISINQPSSAITPDNLPIPADL